MSWSGCGGEVHHSDVDGKVKGWGGLGLGVLRDGVGRVVGWKLMTLFSAQNRSLEGDVVWVGGGR